MRLVYLCREYGRKASGGIETYTKIMAEAMASRGHDVKIITEKGPHSDEATQRGVEVIELTPSAMGLMTSHLEYSFQVFQTIHELEGGIDLIEAPDWCCEAFHCSVDRRIPLITRLHTPSIIVSQENASLYQNNKTLDQLEQVQVFASHAITAPSQAIVDKLNFVWGNEILKTQVIPNPMLLSDSEIVQTNPFDAPYFVYFGRLEPRKGVYTLAKALPKILASNPRLRVVFCGQNTIFNRKSTWHEICKLVGPYSDRIQRAGYLTGLKKKEMVENAVATLVPSNWENFPYTALESLGWGVPVVGTQGCGIEEIIDDGINGVLVAPRDEYDLALGLQQILDPLVNRKLRANARESINRFSVELIATKMERVYQTVSLN